MPFSASFDIILISVKLHQRPILRRFTLTSKSLLLYRFGVAKIGVKGNPITGCPEKLIIWNSAAKKVYERRPDCIWELGRKAPDKINELLQSYGITKRYSDNVIYEFWFEEFSIGENIKKRIRYEHWIGNKEQKFYKNFDYETTYQKKPVTSSDYLKEADDAYDAKRYREAILFCDKAIALYPKSQAAFNQRGFAKIEIKDYDGAIKDFTQAIDINFNIINKYQSQSNIEIHSIFYYGRATAEYYKGDFKKAIKDCETGIAYNSEIDILHLLLGLSKIKIGENGCSDFEKAAQLGNVNATEQLKIHCK